MNCHYLKSGESIFSVHVLLKKATDLEWHENNDTNLNFSKELSNQAGLQILLIRLNSLLKTPCKSYKLIHYIFFDFTFDVSSPCWTFYL